MAWTHLLAGVESPDVPTRMQLLTTAICQWPLTPEFSLLRCPNAQGIWACLYQPCWCRGPAWRAAPSPPGWELAPQFDDVSSCLVSGRAGRTPCPCPLPPAEGPAACRRRCSSLLTTSRGFCLSPRRPTSPTFGGHLLQLHRFCSKRTLSYLANFPLRYFYNLL